MSLFEPDPADGTLGPISSLRHAHLSERCPGCGWTPSWPTCAPRCPISPAGPLRPLGRRRTSASMRCLPGAAQPAVLSQVASGRRTTRTPVTRVAPAAVSSPCGVVRSAESVTPAMSKARNRPQDRRRCASCPWDPPHGHPKLHHSRPGSGSSTSLEIVPSRRPWLQIEPPLTRRSSSAAPEWSVRTS